MVLSLPVALAVAIFCTPVLWQGRAGAAAGAGCHGRCLNLSGGSDRLCRTPGSYFQSSGRGLAESRGRLCRTPGA